MTTGLDLRKSRLDLVEAIGWAIAESPPEHQAKVAEALENFARQRGRTRYEQIVRKSPLLADILGEIEEASDARIFI